jgi:hypothetical protein
LENYLVKEGRGAKEFPDDRYDAVRVSSAMMVLTNKGLFRRLFDITDEDMRLFAADGWQKWLSFEVKADESWVQEVWSKVMDGKRYAFAVCRRR